MELLGKESKELFRELLNDIGPSVTLLGVDYKAGSVLSNMHPEGFDKKYDEFIAKCKEKGIIEESRSGILSKKEKWATNKGEIVILKMAIDVLKDMEI